MPPLASAAFTPTPRAGRMHSASMLFGALCLSALMLSCSGGPFPSYSNSHAFCFYACACSCAGFCFDFRRIRAYPRRPTSSSTRSATRRRALAPCGCCPRSIPAAAAAASAAAAAAVAAAGAQPEARRRQQLPRPWRGGRVGRVGRDGPWTRRGPRRLSGRARPMLNCTHVHVRFRSHVYKSRALDARF